MRQHNRQVRFSASQVALLVRHCPLTGCYFEPWTKEINQHWKNIRTAPLIAATPPCMIHITSSLVNDNNPRGKREQVDQSFKNNKKEVSPKWASVQWQIQTSKEVRACLLTKTRALSICPRWPARKINPDIMRISILIKTVQPCRSVNSSIIWYDLIDGSNHAKVYKIDLCKIFQHGNLQVYHFANNSIMA